jgi:hypothetical protein
MPTDEQKNRLNTIIGWVRTAKENLPAVNDGAVSSDRINEASALLDRMFRVAVALRDQAAVKHPRRAA